ncbi:carbohydrate ABC transporter permease [Candidatus Aerophobetes bacterium]|nr:carbohydrate ABC transporter permease [Candidatus Aerophobetes bacterium]
MKIRWKVKQTKGTRIVLHLALIITSIIMVMPFIWVVFTSFKPKTEIISPTPTIFPHTWTLSNYLRLPETAPFHLFFFNSVFISGISTLAIIIGCPMAGYIFAKYRFKGQTFLFFLIMATILVPLQVYMIPLYLIIASFGWINTYQGMIFPLIVMSSGIFFLRQNILAIPDELISAARIDGCSEYGIFWKIIFPLSFSATAAIAIVNWVFTWSMVFIWYLVVASSAKLFTVELGLMYFQRHFITDYGGTMAACVITFVPVLIVFIIFRRRIIQGVSLTGMKY